MLLFVVSPDTLLVLCGTPQKLELASITRIWNLSLMNDKKRQQHSGNLSGALAPSEVMLYPMDKLNNVIQSKISG